MFRFEHLHDAWLQKCTRYLREVFGSRLAGATVIDYAFGRGNWSVAFARAGAKRIVAIDASKSNVRRFATYCKRTRTSNIEVQLGNVVNDRPDLQADIAWVYGIFHHIKPAEQFARTLARSLAPRGELFLYAYNADCLRQVVAESTRKVLLCSTEAQFRRVAQSLTPAARLRARDDLTAPVVRWYARAELLAHFSRHGLHRSRSVQSFSEYLREPGQDEEFAPHHVVLSRAASSRESSKARPRARPRDFEILRDMADAVLGSSRIPLPQRKAIGIGLLNTHFSALDKPGRAARCGFEDFLFLLYAAVANGLSLERLPGAARDACVLALRKVEAGNVRITSARRRDSLILDAIASRSIRL
jgi:2-polyprenyl-3-methyl-5-hydroxy-6-metoxy-1,4-benzoquinol methylase